MKKFWILSVAVFVMFFAVSCGSGSGSEEKKNDADLEKTDEEKNDEEVTDTEVTDTEITDDEVPLQCEDSEGRKYNKGDRISDECLESYCMDDGGWAKDATSCYSCWGKEIGDKMEWTCDDGVTKVEWCECVEDENYGSKWKCIERADLTCGEPAQCEDSEGRKYKEGDRISDACREAYCSEAGWNEDEMECDGCVVGDKKKWICADGVTEVDWCECLEDEHVYSIWNCVGRADLNCPKE